MTSYYETKKKEDESVLSWLVECHNSISELSHLFFANVGHPSSGKNYPELVS